MKSMYTTTKDDWELRFFNLAARKLDLQAELAGTLRLGDGRSREMIQADLRAVDQECEALMAERKPRVLASV